jgi:hypothetical protein
MKTPYVTHATAVREEMSCASAAIDEQFNARYKTGVIRHQKKRSFSYFVGLPLRSIGMVVLVMRSAPTEREGTPQCRGRLHLQESSS